MNQWKIIGTASCVPETSYLFPRAELCPRCNRKTLNVRHKPRGEGRNPDHNDVAMKICRDCGYVEVNDES